VCLGVPAHIGARYAPLFPESHPPSVAVYLSVIAEERVSLREKREIWTLGVHDHSFAHQQLTNPVRLPAWSLCPLGVGLILRHRQYSQICHHLCTLEITVTSQILSKLTFLTSCFPKASRELQTVHHRQKKRRNIRLSSFSSFSVPAMIAKRSPIRVRCGPSALASAHRL
jgi:hypothetical protein